MSGSSSLFVGFFGQMEPLMIQLIIALVFNNYL